MKYYLTLLLYFFTICLYSQDTLQVLESPNGNNYAYSRKLTVISKDEQMCASFYLDIREKYNYIEAKGIHVSLFNFGDESEDNELIIIFDDNTRIAKISDQGYQLGNRDWFYLSENEIVKLATTEIERIWFMNGMYYDIVDAKLNGMDRSYFIRVLDMIKKLNIKNTEDAGN